MLTHVSTFNLTFPSNTTLYHIYSSILSGHCASFSEEVRNVVRPITRMTMTLYA